MSLFVFQADVEYRWDGTQYKELESARFLDSYTIKEMKETLNVDVPPGKAIEIYNKDVVPANLNLDRDDFACDFQPQSRIQCGYARLVNCTPQLLLTDAPAKLSPAAGSNAILQFTVEVHTSTSILDEEFELDVNFGDILGSAVVLGTTRRLVHTYSAILVTTVIGVLNNFRDIPVLHSKFAIRHSVRPDDQYDSFGIGLRLEIKIFGTSFQWNPKLLAEYQPCYDCGMPQKLPTIIYEDASTTLYPAGPTRSSDYSIDNYDCLDDAPSVKFHL